jgi:hypothetical protein
MTTGPSQPAPARPQPPEPTSAVRGASEEVLARPACVYLASLRWDGSPDDPDTLSAAAFLSRL